MEVLKVLKKRVKAKKGFTLIELMIVVAILGILAAIAIPTYMDYTKRAKVSEAVSLLSGVANAMAEYHSSLGVFTNNLSDIGGNKTSRYVTNMSADNTTNSNYVIINATLDKIGPGVNGHWLALYVIYRSANETYEKCWSWNMSNKYVPSSLRDKQVNSTCNLPT